MAGHRYERPFFLPPRTWHAVAALRLVAASGVFVFFCCALDYEGVMACAILLCCRFTCVRSSY